MTYKMKLILSSIAALAFIAAITVGIIAYRYQHHIASFGNTLVLANMFLNMTVIIVSLALMRNHQENH